MRYIPLILLFLFSSEVLAGESTINFLTVGTSRTRPLAMGSAYNSVHDDFSAGFYNPAAFRVISNQGERPFRIFFKPIALATALKDYNDHDLFYNKDDKLTTEEALYSASMLFKGIVLTTPLMDMGIGLNEEIILSDSTDASRGRVFSVKGTTKYSFNSFFMNFRVSDPVVIGFTGTLFHSRENGDDNYEGGYTAGILLIPDPKLNVGIVYNKIPEKFSNARTGLEYIENETISSGISYYPNDKTILSLDIRSLNKEDAITSREIHCGFERKFMDRVAIRGGYYRKKADTSNVFSAGLGILPNWGKIDKFVHMTRTDLLSYTFVAEQDDKTKYWHVFSLLLQY